MTISITASLCMMLFACIRTNAQDTVSTTTTTVTHTTNVDDQNKNNTDQKKNENPPLRVVELGVRYMPTFTQLTFNTSNGETVKGTATVSNGYGVLLGINFSKNIGIVGEVNYNEIMQKYKDMSLEREVDIQYLNIPVMLSINTDKTLPVNLNLVAGPQFGLNVGSSVKGSSSENTDTVHAVLALKQGDIGLAYGAGLEFALNKMHTIRLDLGFRGMYGFVDMSTTPAGNNTYNILVKGSRKTYAGYGGITFCF